MGSAPLACLSCGEPLPADASFCSACGKAAPADSFHSGHPDAALGRQGFVRGITTRWKAASPRDRRMALAAVAAAIAFGAAIWFLPLGPDTSPEPETGTLTVQETPAP